MEKVTPMMRQYMDIKKEYKYCILFFRLGDFYEMFFDDALIAAKVLNITLTGKSYGQATKAPMCGVPVHSADAYVNRLIEAGYKVAICEQTADPAETPGLVPREVVRVITSGTVIDEAVLDSKKNNYLMSIYGNKRGYAISVCDITTGEFITTEFSSVTLSSNVIDSVARFSPVEIIYNEDFANTQLFIDIENNFKTDMTSCDNWSFEFSNALEKICSHFEIDNIYCFGLEDKNISVSSSGALLNYLYENQKSNLSYIKNIKYYSASRYMHLDYSTRRNLELSENSNGRGVKGTLFSVLDKTETSMGARLLRKYIENPLINLDEIADRQGSVLELFKKDITNEEIKENLAKINDFERIAAKIAYKNANARDLLALKNAIFYVKDLKVQITALKSNYFKNLAKDFDDLHDIYTLIDSAIADEPPVSIKDGGMFKPGFDGDVDVFLKTKINGVGWILQLEEEERKKTGIKNLKVRHNKVFGYYIEISKSSKKDVPDYYVRKQTLANSERYVTDELLKLAELILSSEDKLATFEYELFGQMIEKISGYISRIQKTASEVSTIDVLSSFAKVAKVNNYVQPTFNYDGVIEIIGGRHPVVEAATKSPFVVNDTLLDLNKNNFSIITGPNMAGKSTYMRQVALITLMAQIGSFVPATSCNLNVVDRIFTRVGATDDVFGGRSTFMVEMTEVANILNNATENSLVILDEIGRGTSTFDGLSIAWAVVEHIVKLIKCKTLFATHYHELSEIENSLDGVKNYYINVKEENNEIIFLREILVGNAKNSYGVQVAKLAGLPFNVIKRSKQILKQLDASDIAKKSKKISNELIRDIDEPEQINLFNQDESGIIAEIKGIDVMALSPMEALQKLFELQKKSKGL